MVRETDVLVIGGGATGTGIARDLAMRGVDTVLIEAGGLASSTTGHSHSLLHSGARYVPGDPQSADECIEENRILTEIAGHCVADTGGLFVELEADDDEYFEEKIESCREHDIEVDVRSGETARKEVPVLASDVERAARVPDGVIYPSRLTAATAASAHEHGAEIITHTTVTDLLTVDGNITGAMVRDEDDHTETVHATHVVNATGAWAGQISAMADIDIEMRPTKGVMVALNDDRLETVLNRCRPPTDGDIIVPHDKQVILGTTSEEVADPDEYPKEEQEVERMFEECTAMFPDIDPNQTARTYWGVRPLYSPPAEEEDERAISRGFSLLDHTERDDIAGLTSIVGGKLTTHRQMAEVVADHVCDQLGVAGDCRTAAEPLPGSDDPSALDEFVREFAGSAPADKDVTNV
jgi:glycerol-3-phosphate dehydrogenase